MLGIQSLQAEVHRVSALNQQLQQKLTSLAETKRGRAEADWKRIESEKRVRIISTSDAMSIIIIPWLHEGDCVYNIGAQ